MHQWLTSVVLWLIRERTPDCIGYRARRRAPVGKLVAHPFGQPYSLLPLDEDWLRDASLRKRPLPPNAGPGPERADRFMGMERPHPRTWGVPPG